MSRPMLHLASSSPRRRELLAALGVDFTVEGVEVEERRLDEETPQAMVLRLAAAKACAAAEGAQRFTLGADTAVVLDGRVFGKPAGATDALSMLAALSGRRHQVMTGVALRAGGEVTTALSVSDVVFRDIEPDEARRYWQSGEPADKAGAYAIQGLGGVFVVTLEGSYSGVVGLPVFETAELLRAAGLDVFGRYG